MDVDDVHKGRDQLVRNASLVERDFEHDRLLLDSESGATFHLDPIGWVMWETAVIPVTRQALIAVCHTLNSSRESGIVEREAERILQQLVNLGILLAEEDEKPGVVTQ